MRNNIPKGELALKSVELAKTIEDRTKRETCIVSTITFAGKYLDIGFSVDKISKITGLEVEVIEKLKGQPEA